MKISSLRIQNFRAYQDTQSVKTSEINVFIGANNSGKSSILRAIHMIQDGHQASGRDIRLGEDFMSLNLNVQNFSHYNIAPKGSIDGIIHATLLSTHSAVQLSLQENNNNTGFSCFPLKEPHHAIVPFYSLRKSFGFSEQTNSEIAKTIHGNFTNLSAKLARLVNPEYQGHSKYVELCTKILGKPIFVVPSSGGQAVGRYVGMESIEVSHMGDGVPHILHLLAELINSDEKIFLIEEPENDLHPQALKALLDFIIEKSESNQFFITTHSNIVVRHLGAVTNSAIFKVWTDLSRDLPTSRVELVPTTSHARIDVLRELGYTLADFELREGWLILEESSAGRLITEFLIPWFAPKVACLSVVAAGGVDKVEPTFEDFRRLILYSHLQHAYQRKTWVRVDGDKGGHNVVDRLHEAYKEWPADRFQAFGAEQFERYYPAEFQEQASEVLSLTNRPEKREAKQRLLKEVLVWLRADPVRGKAALEASAGEVIADLRAIEAEL